MSIAGAADTAPSALPLEGYLSAVHARWLAQESGAAWRCLDASLLFADVSGFTALSERLAKRGRVGSEELTDVVNAVFGALLEVCRGLGGDVVKFGGDALLVLFPRAGHAERACAAAAGMQAAMRPFGRLRTDAGTVSLRMSVGVATGPVDLFLVGELHREMIVTGPTATHLMALEGAANAGEVLISEATDAALPPGCTGAPGGDRPGRLLRLAPPVPLVGELRRRADEDPRAGLPPHLHAAAPADGEHRTLAIGFVQVKGIGGLLDRQGPDAVVAALDDVVSRAQHACRAHGVSFISTDVDADACKLILVAGAPTASPDDSDRLLHAVREVVCVPQVLMVRGGVNRGQAFVVEVGSPDRRSYTVMGDPVNLAARVMGKAGVGEVLATRGLLDRVRTPFERVALEPFHVKGKTELIEADVVGDPGGGTRRPEHERYTDAPLVGRDREQKVLRGAVDAARSGRTAAVVLVGEPGIGKSRLAQAFTAAADGMTLVTVEAGPYATASPYYAMRAPMRGLIGLSQRHGEAAVAERLRATVAELDPELEQWLPLLARPFGVELDPTPETAALSPEFERARLHQVVARLLDALLPPGRTAVVVEDAQWLDDASGELLASLVHRAEGWAVCLTRRPVDGGLVLREEPGVTILEVGPLPAGAAVELAAADGEGDADGGRRLTPAEREALVERSHGNPLFLQELLTAARKGRTIDELPDTVEELLTARIDTLPPDDRAFLRQASVLGQRTRTRLLEELLEASAFLVRATIRRLDAFLVEEGPGRIRFRHALVRDVAYSTLSYRRRRELHARAGELVEELAGDAPEEVAELLSLHFHAAQRWTEAWRWSRLAGEQALRRGAPVDAVTLFQRALEAGGKVPEVPAADGSVVAEQLGDACEIAARYDEADDAYRLARRLTARDDHVRIAELYRKQGWVRQWTRAYSRALAWYTKGQRVLDRAPGGPAVDETRARLWMEAGLARLRQARYRDAIPLLEKGLAGARAAGDRRSEARAYYLLNWAWTDLGETKPEYRDAPLAIYEELGDLLGQANTLNNLGICHYQEGRWHDALDCYERSLTARMRIGDVLQTATTSLNIAEVLIRQARYAEAEARVRPALETCRALEHPLAISFALTLLGALLTLRGDIEDGERELDAALAAAREIGSERYVVEIRVLQAQALMLSGRSEDALALVEETAATVERIGGVPFWASNLHRVAACALAQQGRLDEARARFDRSLAVARDADARYEEVVALTGLARLAERRGESPAALLAEAARLRAGLAIEGELPLRLA